MTSRPSGTAQSSDVVSLEVCCARARSMTVVNAEPWCGSAADCRACGRADGLCAHVGSLSVLLGRFRLSAGPEPGSAGRQQTAAG